ncbi:licB [Symbiodinium natans]|uniref:LicB protein n=1 Tax=Symbiodinium natans TaxID=878477 RepID=A0A812PB06_9DINO|nr:licB [Symbiodinium natans]
MDGIDTVGSEVLAVDRRFTWELRVDRLPVLYTHQKATRRRVLREGSLRLAAGLAVLLDAENRALDEQTVTVALLDQLERGEEIVAGYSAGSYFAAPTMTSMWPLAQSQSKTS